MSEPINILVVDDHRVFAEGLVAVLKISFPHAKFELANSGEQAWARILESPTFDLVSTDISMPGITGLELATRIKQQYPDIKVLVLSMHNERQIVSAALATEAEGFVLKTATAKEIATAITDLLGGRTHYGREVLNVMLEKAKDEKMERPNTNLTEREAEILKLIVEENSNEQMAEKLFISKRTIETHRKHIMEKTGCKNLISLYKFAVGNGLIETKARG
jgi:DNA-binding NarL/FixJ family response regulator